METFKLATQVKFGFWPVMLGLFELGRIFQRASRQETVKEREAGGKTAQTGEIPPAVVAAIAACCLPDSRSSPVRVTVAVPASAGKREVDYWAIAGRKELMANGTMLEMIRRSKVK